MREGPQGEDQINAHKMINLDLSVRFGSFYHTSLIFHHLIDTNGHYEDNDKFTDNQEATYISLTFFLQRGQVWEILSQLLRHPV